MGCFLGERSNGKTTRGGPDDARETTRPRKKTLFVLFYIRRGILPFAFRRSVLVRGRLERPLAQSPSSTGLDEPAGACDRTHSAGSRLEAVARAPSLPKPRTRGSADRRARSGSRVLDRRALVASFVRPSRPTPRARCPPRRRTRPPPTLTKSPSPSFRKRAPSTTSFSSVLLFMII